MGNRHDSGKKQSRGLLDFLRARGKMWLLVAGVVLGVFLLLFGSGFGEQASGDETVESVTEDAADLQAYREKLEKQIRDICDAVYGVSGVEVMVTLESGSRVVYTTDGNGDPATIGSGSSQQALYRTLQPPTVAGVGVVCNGGDNPSIQHTLTDLISTALGISTNRVCVAGK